MWKAWKGRWLVFQCPWLKQVARLHTSTSFAIGTTVILIRRLLCLRTDPIVKLQTLANIEKRSDNNRRVGLWKRSWEVPRKCIVTSEKDVCYCATTLPLFRDCLSVMDEWATMFFPARIALKSRLLLLKKGTGGRRCACAWVCGREGGEGETRSRSRGEMRVATPEIPGDSFSMFYESFAE